MSLADRDPHDEFGVLPGTPPETVGRAYRRRVVEVHRRGVWRIVAGLRRAQQALAALSNPVDREHHAAVWHRRRRELSEDLATRQRRELVMLRAYKERLGAEAGAAGARSREENAVELAWIEQRLEAEELREARLARRRALASAASKLILILILGAAALWLWTHFGLT